MEPYLEDQNKTFPKGNLRILVVLFRIVPLLGITGFAVGVGYKVGIQIPEVGGIYHQIISWGLFIGLLILREERGWNLALLFGAAIMAGTLLSELNLEINSSAIWIFFGGLVIFSIGGGLISGYYKDRTINLLFPITLLYCIGGLLVGRQTQQYILQESWFILGLVLFSLAAILVIGRRKTLEEDINPLPLGCELFVIYFNLFWLAGGLLLNFQ